MNKTVKKIAKGVSGVGCLSVGSYVLYSLVSAGAIFEAPIWALASLGTALGGGMLLKQSLKNQEEQQ